MRTPNGNLIVVLPGILGSRLRRGTRQTWGFGQLFRTLGGFSDRLTEDLSLSLKAYSDQENGDDDGTIVDGLMQSAGPTREAATIPGFWTLLDGYKPLLARIEQLFDPRDLIAFPYDWRQSNRVSARRLQQLVEPLMHERRRTHSSAQLILIGHSMGGLVARYYAECLDLERFTSRVITIGTPYQGAVKALAVLANGRIGFSAGPLQIAAEIGALARSLPSVAELLPIYPCIGTALDSLAALDDIAHVPGLPAFIRDHALAFHRELADAVAGHDADHATYSPILCHRQPTPYWVRIGASGVEMQSPDEVHLRGDATVSRISAIPPEWVDRGAGAYVNARHAGLHGASGTWEQVMGLLTGTAPRRAMADGEELIVDAPEYVAPGESWTVAARAVSGNESLALVVEVTGDSGDTARSPLRLRESAFSATLHITSPGIKRWTVSPDPMSNTAAGPIADVLICAEP